MGSVGGVGGAAGPQGRGAVTGTAPLPRCPAYRNAKTMNIGSTPPHVP
jgi:hypothetical protein